MICTVGNLKILDTLTASRDEPVWRFFVRALDYFSALRSVARNVPTCSRKFQSIFARLILRYFNKKPSDRYGLGFLKVVRGTRFAKAGLTVH